MSKLQPALVYAAPANREETNDYLLSHGLYRWDDATETDVDMARLPDARPVLHRQLAWAEGTDFEVHGLERPPGVPRVFVADRLSSLGPNVAWQAAVVGLMLERVGSVKIVCGGAEDSKEWFEEQLSGEGWKSMYPRMDTLRDLDQTDGVLLRSEAADGMEWLPTTFLRTWSAACLRARTLKDEDGQLFAAMANTLAVEGYNNANDRVTWYPTLAREAYEAGQ